jgi:hypothetical protein
MRKMEYSITMKFNTLFILAMSWVFALMAVLLIVVAAPNGARAGEYGELDDTVNRIRVHNEPSAGEVIGDVVVSSSKDMANGVAITSHAAADTLDNLTWAGCKMARWAVGERRDRTASIGNTIVGLVFRLPVTLLSGGICAASAVLSMPAEASAYGFDVLAGVSRNDNPGGGQTEGTQSQYADSR